MGFFLFPHLPSAKTIESQKSERLGFKKCGLEQVTRQLCQLGPLPFSQIYVGIEMLSLHFIDEGAEAV